MSLCNPNWPQTHDTPASVSQVAGITGVLHHVWLIFLLCFVFKITEIENGVALIMTLVFLGKIIHYYSSSLISDKVKAVVRTVETLRQITLQTASASYSHLSIFILVRSGKNEHQVLL